MTFLLLVLLWLPLTVGMLAAARAIDRRERAVRRPERTR